MAGGRDIDGATGGGDGPAAVPAALTPEEAARWERLARRLLLWSSGAMFGMVGLIALGLAMAPKDDSTLGVMKALVFRCH